MGIPGNKCFCRERGLIECVGADIESRLITFPYYLTRFSRPDGCQMRASFKRLNSLDEVTEEQLLTPRVESSHPVGPVPEVKILGNRRYYSNCSEVWIPVSETHLL